MGKRINPEWGSILKMGSGGFTFNPSRGWALPCPHTCPPDCIRGYSQLTASRLRGTAFLLPAGGVIAEKITILLGALSGYKSGNRDSG